MYASEGLAYGFLLLAAAILLGFLLVVPARAHDWYGGMISPITEGSCCSERDCHPVSAAPDDEGVWWVYEDGVKKRVPERAFLDRTAPDGNSHVCETSTGIICFIRGVPKS